MLLLRYHGSVLLLKLRHFLLTATRGSYVGSCSHLRIAPQRRVLALVLCLAADHVNWLLRCTHHGLGASGALRRRTSRQLLLSHSRDRLMPVPCAWRTLRLSPIVRHLLVIISTRHVGCHNIGGSIADDITLLRSLLNLHLRNASSDHLLRASVGGYVADLMVVASGLLRSCIHHWLVLLILMIILVAHLSQVVKHLVLLIGRRRLICHLVTATHLSHSRGS